MDIKLTENQEGSLMPFDAYKHKVQLMRMSGQPPEPEDFANFSKKWEAFFDLVQEYYAQDMKAVHVRLERYDSLLRRQFPSIVEIEFPNSAKEWSAMLAKYKQPLLVANTKDTGDLILVIADQLG